MLANQTKRWLAMLLAVVMILSAVPAPVFAAEEENHDHAEVTVIPEEAPEETEAGPSQEAQDLVSRINALLELYGITAQMTDLDIRKAINAQPWSSVNKPNITEVNEILALAEVIPEDDYAYVLENADVETYVRFTEIFKPMFAVVKAASGTHTPVTGVTVAVSGATDNSMSSGAITVTAKGSAGILGYGASAKTATVTIYNNSGSKAKLSFDWTASSVKELKIDGAVYSGTGGSFSKVLDNEGSFTVTITTDKNSTVNKLIMQNFAVEIAKDASNVTFQYDNALGSITVGGTAVDSGAVKEISQEGAALVATAKSGAAFLGWIDAQTHEIISTAASFTLEPANDMSIQAVFAKNAWFLVNGNCLYGDLTEAISVAEAGTNKTVVLYNNGTLPAGNYTIPAGITLLVPYNASNTLCTTTPSTTDASYEKPTAYRTLTMAEGANLVVNGVLSVSGTMHTGTPYPGATRGPLGFVNMATGSNITVNNGGKLYCWGYITGTGSVTVENGATVYENFQAAGFKGGDNTSKLASNTYGVFPFTNYYIQNIEVPMTIKAGAIENGYMAVNITLAGINGAEVPFIGPNGMFNINSGYIVKDLEESTGRLVIDVCGGVDMKNLSITMKVSLLGNTTIDSSKFFLPVTNNLTVRVKNGGSVIISQDLNILPGAQLYIEQGSDITLSTGKSVVFYDQDEWKLGNFAYLDTKYYPVKYSPSSTVYTVAQYQTDKGDAFAYVEGTLDASAGYVYTSSGGAAITATEGAKVILKAGTRTTNYEVHMGGSDGKTLEYTAIPLTPAKLQNADGTYYETAGISYGEFTYENGVWSGKCLDPHIEVEDAAVPATCNSTGLTAGSHCSACGTVITAQEVVPALEHTVVIDAAVTATCTTAGKTEGSHCSACGTVIVAQTEIPAPGHTEVVDAAVAPGCDRTGLTEGKHCSVCNEVIVAQEEVAALGHKYTTAVTAPTCTGKGYTTYTCDNCHASYVSDYVDALGHTPGAEATCNEAQTCTVCGTELQATLGHDMIRDDEVPATCTTPGSQAGAHCSRCDYTEGKEVIEALGHTEVIDEAVAATCTATGLTEGKHCSVCNEVIVAQTEVAAKGHTEVIDEAVAATCTATGLTEGKHCSVCNEVIVAQTEVAAKGHTEVIDEAVAATCTATGLTEGKHCSVCSEVIVAQTEVAAKGHTEVIDEAVAATCTATGLTEGKHCSVCSEVIAKQTVVDALGHSKAEDNTCTNCGETLVAVMANGETVYLPIAEALTTGYDIALLALTKGENVVLAQGVTLDLNGYMLTANTFDAVAPGTQVIDTVGGGVLIAPDAEFASDNAQLPVYDSKEGGYRFFTVSVELIAVTGKNSTPKYWFTVNADEALKTLAAEGADIRIQAKMTWEGQSERYASAEPEFTRKWALSGAKYITVTVEGSENYENFNLIPCLTSTGVEVSAEAKADTGANAQASASIVRGTYKAGAKALRAGSAGQMTVKNTDAGTSAAPVVHSDYCADGQHQIFYYDAKLPTFHSAGYEAYEDCLRCSYTTYVPLPALEIPAVEDFETFIYKLTLLEMVAEMYIVDHPEKDPVELVIKYIRTGVDRYNSGSWGIMAGYEDQDFADFVITVEDGINAQFESVDDMICISSMKDIETFTLPNGDLADLGHIFGTMDITNHNKSSQNHADVGGWAGDLVDLLEYCAVSKVSGTLDEMIAEIRANYLGQSPEDPDQSAMNQLDINGDLDVLNIMDQLYGQEYYTGMLSEIFMMYFTEDLNEEARADYFLRNRLGGITNRMGVRDAVYKAYTTNRVVSTLEGTRDFGVNNLDDLRKAVCYAFADYVCQLAGDYYESTENPYYSIFSSTYDVLAPGISQEIKMATSADGEQMVYYVATVDITRDDVDVFVNYNNNDPAAGWAMQRVLDQANAAQEKYGNPESEYYIPNYNVIVSTNASGFNMSTGEPGGLLVMGGVEYHPINGDGFFGITKEGKPVFGTTADYNNIYKGQLRDGVAGFGATLIKEGKVVAPAGSTRASRTSIGVTKTGKIVMMVFDGRQGVWSTGANYEEMAQVMLEAGCVHAINLDGGGSTTFVARQPGEEELSLVNRPSDGIQRSVATSIFAVSTAPSSTAFDHAVIESEANHITKNSSIQLTAKGLSATGNDAELPGDLSWDVSSTFFATITQDGVLTGLRNGSVEVYLYSGDVLIGNKTIEIVVPDNIYFAKANIDAVYGASVDLEIKAMYQGKPVVMNDADIKLSLSNGKAGTLNGYRFTATANENAGIKNLSIVATLVADESVSGVANVSLYKQGEATFDFDQATGGDRTLAWYREVTNADQEDANTYIIVDPDEDMVTKYTLAIDMTQIPIPKKLEDLTYMLPGSDVAGASAWTFLLQLAERISDLSTITAQVQFDKNLNVDVSDIVIVNEYFNLNGVTLDEETNTVTMSLSWIKQDRPIDAATANSMCIVSGIVLTPKDDASWSGNGRLNIANVGSISYKIYMRASSLVSFAEKPENQAVYGLYPYHNPNDSYDSGAYFQDTYKTFEDSYVIIGSLKEGWVNEDGGFAYYENGKRLTGVALADGFYYDFGENGINEGKTKYSGLFENDGKYYYAAFGELISGWRTVGDDYYYFSTADYTAHTGVSSVAGRTYTFDETGKLIRGDFVKTADGVKYYWAGKVTYQRWITLEEGTYWASPEGYIAYGNFPVKEDHSRPAVWYSFDEETGVLISICDGFFRYEGNLYYCENGVAFDGATKTENGIVFTSPMGLVSVNAPCYINSGKCNGCTLETGWYDTDANGYVVKDGFADIKGNTYYFTDYVRAKGFTKIGEKYYFFNAGNGTMQKNVNMWVSGSNPYGIPSGTYFFQADGTMYVPDPNGERKVITENGKLYFTIDGVKQKNGLNELDGEYYYANSNGTLVTNRTIWISNFNGLIAPGSGYFAFDAEGKLVKTGFADGDNGYTYYYVDLVRQKGFTKIGEDYYFLNAGSGAMQRDKTMYVSGSNPYGIPSGNYYFQADGTMYVPDPNGPRAVIEENGKLYFTIDGVKQKNGLNELDGEYYYANSNGTLVTNRTIWISNFNGLIAPGSGYFAFDAEGKLVKTGFAAGDNGYTYYYEDLVRVKGFTKIGEDYYFLNAGSGAMQCDKTMYVSGSNPYGIPSGSYYFDAEGKMVIN